MHACGIEDINQPTDVQKNGPHAAVALRFLKSPVSMVPLLQVSLAMIKACLWRSHAAAHGDQAASAQTAASTAAITDQLNRSLAAMHLTTRDAGASTTVGSRSRADGGWGWGQQALCIV
jgi:hypothetical protein